MADYSRYLIIEDPLVVLPTIARALDINKAIILQQIQYWLRKSKHERDGHRWVWNSYREWSQQFTWLTPRAIRHHIKELENLGLLVAGEYNRDTRDKTKWYRIDYAAVDDLVTKSSHGVSTGGTPPVVEGSVQEPPEVVALPETTTETTTENTPISKDRYGEFKNVLLSDDEMQKLLDRFGGALIDKIEALSSYKKSKGKNYKDDYATILNWARKDGNVSVAFHGDKTDTRSNDPDKYVKGAYGHMVNR